MACSLLMAGCSDDKDNDGDDVIWDFANASFYFNVVDEEGKSLLQKDNADNILDNKIYVDYQEKKFERVLPDQPTPRANKPKDLELSLYDNVEHPDVPMLSFGEFSPTDNYKGESFTVYWGEGSKSEIKFDYHITWNKKEPTTHTNLYVDGRLYFKFTPSLSISGFPVVTVKLKRGA